MTKLGLSNRLKINIQDLRLVTAIAHRHSVTLAASDLNLSQSAVSHQLGRLEQSLDVRLFDRVGKRMLPNQSCDLLLELAEETLPKFLSVQQQLLNSPTEKTPMCISASCLTYYGWLSEAIVAFSDKQPGNEVRIRHQAREDEVSALQKGSIDLLITAYPPSGASFIIEKLVTLDVCVLLSSNHPLSERKRLYWKQLEGERLLVHDIPTQDVDRLKADVEHCTVERVHLSEAIVQFVKLGQGIGVIGVHPRREQKLSTGLRLIAPLPRESRTLWGVRLASNPRELPISELLTQVRNFNK